MAVTSPDGLIYPDDYQDPADSPAAFEDLAVSTQNALSKRAITYVQTATPASPRVGDIWAPI